MGTNLDPWMHRGRVATVVSIIILTIIIIIIIVIIIGMSSYQFALFLIGIFCDALIFAVQTITFLLLVSLLQ
jgi:hypothetical protein